MTPSEPSESDQRVGLEQELLDIERTLWTNDAEVYERTFLPEAVIIFPEVGRIGLESAVQAIRDESAADRRWADVSFVDVRVMMVTRSVALLHYQASARWNYAKESERVLCATLYLDRNGSWRVAFHQQTAM